MEDDPALYSPQVGAAVEDVCEGAVATDSGVEPSVVGADPPLGAASAAAAAPPAVSEGLAQITHFAR